MTFELQGIDVSHFQNPLSPGGTSWAEMANVKFMMVRLSYGTWKDPSAPAFFQQARARKIAVGGYHFVRTTQSIADQLEVFHEQALTCGYTIGDIAPAMDVEDDPKVASISPTWVPLIQQFSDGLLARFGESLVYDTQRDFGRLGKPAFILQRPNWVAHYTNAPAPATPGNIQARIWQKRVGPYVANGPGGAFNPMVLDQNVATGPLPLVLQAISTLPKAAPVTDTPPDHSFEELRQLRLDNLTTDLYAHLDLSHDDESGESYNS